MWVEHEKGFINLNGTWIVCMFHIMELIYFKLLVDYICSGA